jgi:hypothetical protein
MKRIIFILLLVTTMLALVVSCNPRKRTQAETSNNGFPVKVNSVEEAADAIDDLYYKPCTREEFKEKTDKMEKLEFVNRIEEKQDGFLVIFSDGSEYFYLFKK